MGLGHGGVPVVAGERGTGSGVDGDESGHVSLEINIEERSPMIWPDQWERFEGVDLSHPEISLTEEGARAYLGQFNYGSSSPLFYRKADLSPGQVSLTFQDPEARWFVDHGLRLFLGERHHELSDGAAKYFKEECGLTPMELHHSFADNYSVLSWRFDLEETEDRRR